MPLARVRTVRVDAYPLGIHEMMATHRMPTTSVPINLHIVVIRLLAIAIWQTRRRTPALSSYDLPLPGEYRRWEVVETGGMQQHGGERLKCYVCAKGAATPDDESFPVGTRFVVETYRTMKSFSCRVSVPGEVEQEPVRVFIMKKYAAFQWNGDGAPMSEVWACALYR